MVFGSKSFFNVISSFYTQNSTHPTVDTVDTRRWKDGKFAWSRRILAFNNLLKKNYFRVVKLTKRPGFKTRIKRFEQL